jgi:hypothetical protein
MPSRPSSASPAAQRMQRSATPTNKRPGTPPRSSAAAKAKASPVARSSSPRGKPAPAAKPVPAAKPAPAAKPLPIGKPTPAARPTGHDAPTKKPPRAPRSASPRPADDGEAAAVARMPLALTRGAPGAAAKAYAARINKLLGGERSAAALLVDSAPASLACAIDASHDHSTLSALGIPRSVEVVEIRRPGARVASLSVAGATKVAMGDVLTLRAPPHVLAAVALIKQPKATPTLAPRHAREKLTAQIKTERALLLAAATALQAQLLPLVRRQLSVAHTRSRERAAATRLQAVRRGQLLRRSVSGLLELHRSRQKAARLRGRRLMASMLKAQHEAPLCSKACFVPPTPEQRSLSSARRAVWIAQPANAASAAQYAKLAATAKSHCGTLSRHAGAAPEARKLKHALPWAPLRLLAAPSLELTATLDKRANHSTVGVLALPSTVRVVHLRVNNRSMAAPKNGTALKATKLLDGDQLCVPAPRSLYLWVGRSCALAGAVVGCWLALSPSLLAAGWPAAHPARRGIAESLAVGCWLARRSLTLRYDGSRRACAGRYLGRRMSSRACAKSRVTAPSCCCSRPRNASPSTRRSSPPSVTRCTRRRRPSRRGSSGSCGHGSN